jgi:hypothetical protein|tara:strand:+ start:421 stop:780 length:360 start_codon:yes stop_codon:yes gene_type:complete
MKLKYNEIKSIYAENIEYEENGITFTANIIKTEYIPQVFKGTTKNFCLRENHENSQALHDNFKSKCKIEWLEELGYDITQYRVDAATNEIITVENKVNTYFNIDEHKIEDLPITESTKI